MIYSYLILHYQGKFVVPLTQKERDDFNKKEDDLALSVGWRKLAGQLVDNIVCAVSVLFILPFVCVVYYLFMRNMHVLVFVCLLACLFVCVCLSV